jgi:RNA-directed DNA polymerase
MADRKAPPTPEPTAKVSEPWSKLPWKKFEKHVFRIQKRIYRASQRGKTRAVQKLQKLLMKSEAARLLAVRRVTQDNQGKKTAGIDGVKSVPPNRRLVMAEQIHPKHWRRSKPRPVRRVWIPKPGKAEKRPLGIPTMLNRAEQALGKMALEPEWEAKFEGNSYGFRPGRSCHDAIDAIFEAIRYKAKFVFDADIKGCFDHINQEALLEKLHTYPAMKRLIEGWLKAGMLERDIFTPTEAGTPQGGVASPLLANIALHGMEEAIAKGYRKGVEKPILIRYADDLVILHSDKEILGHAAQTVTDFLEGIGLQPKEDEDHPYPHSL